VTSPALAVTFLMTLATGPTWAAVVTAGASFVTALGGLILAFTVLLPLLRTSKETHKLVNQAHTDAINYQNALIRALKDSGIVVPRDQSQPNGDIK
jgi:hypothetical protein